MRRSAESRRGFTLVEALIWGLIMAVVAGLVATALHWARLSWSAGVERLDQYGALRMASLRLSHELAFARRLLYPPPGQPADPPHHQILFLGEQNELRGCFVDPSGKLMLVTKDANDKEEPLTRNTVRLEVRRSGRHFVEYVVTVLDEAGREVSLGDGLWIRNHE